MGVDSSDVQCSPGVYVSHFHCPPVVGFAYVLVHMVLDSIFPLYTWDLLILYALSTGCCCLLVSPVHLVLVCHGFPVHLVLISQGCSSHIVMIVYGLHVSIGVDVIYFICPAIVCLSCVPCPQCGCVSGFVDALLC